MSKRWTIERFVTLLLLQVTVASAPGWAGTSSTAYVVSSQDSRIARVDLDTGQVNLAIATTGTVANRAEFSEELGIGFVVNSGSDDVTLFDVASESVVGSISLPPGTNPWTIEVEGLRAWVTGLRSNDVSEIDLTTSTIVTTAATGRSPEGMCIADGKLYVANTGFDFDTFAYDPGSVSVFSLVDLSLLATIAVPLNPQECLIAPNGTVHVVCTGDFFATQGAIAVIDPASDTVTSTMTVPSFPGGGTVRSDGLVFLNVTTASFGSEVWIYDSASLSFVRDAADPLLPTLDFYGNLRADFQDRVFVPNFGSDLLIEIPSDTNTLPSTYSVGDGPIDLWVVEREDPVPLAMSGFRAVSVEQGIELSWQGTPEADIVAFVVARGDFGREADRIVATVSPRRDNVWLDTHVAPGQEYEYRVGFEVDGEILWGGVARLTHTLPQEARFAIQRTFPNPTRGPVTLTFSAVGRGSAVVEVFDVRGRRVSSRSIQTAGSSQLTEVRWNGDDLVGNQVAPGRYHIRVSMNGQSRTTSVTRLR